MNHVVVLAVAFLSVCGHSACHAQRNDPTKNVSNKEKGEEMDREGQKELIKKTEGF